MSVTISSKDRFEKVSYDNDVNNYIAGLVTPLSSSTLTKINTFVTDLKTDLSITNLSEVFDVMYILANETSEAAMRNLVERDHDLTDGNSTTFTAFEGFTGDGTSDYLIMDYDPSVDNVNIGLDNIMVGYYSRTADLNDVAEAILGVIDGTDALRLGYGDFGSGNYGISIKINTGTYSYEVTYDEALSGLFIGGRTNATEQTIRKNKNTVFTKTRSSIAIPNGNIYVLAGNYIGEGADLFSLSQLSFVFISKYMTDAQCNYLVDCFEAYMDSNGKGVI